MDKNDYRQEIAQLAGALADHLLQHIINPANHLSWRDAVYAASLAIKAVGMVAMQKDTEPLSLEQTEQELERIFDIAQKAAVVPVMDDSGGPLQHQYHPRQ